MQAFEPQPPDQLRRQAALYRRLARTMRDRAAAARLDAWADAHEARAGAAAAPGE